MEMVSAIASVIGAVISGLVAIYVCHEQNATALMQVNQKHNEQILLIEQRLKELEKKVDKHNNLVERMYRVEAQLQIQEG